ncbi:hypothetical protein LINPERPRIM_LOCUS24132, partial [Linum perenne]
IHRNWEIRLRHTYCEGNKAVDHLAERDPTLSIGSHSIPVLNGYFLRNNFSRISELRSLITKTIRPFSQKFSFLLCPNEKKPSICHLGVQDQRDNTTLAC